MAAFLRRLWNRLAKPQIIDREYIEDETGAEIEHIDDTNYPDKAERPLPHIPESHDERPESHEEFNDDQEPIRKRRRAA